MLNSYPELSERRLAAHFLIDNLPPGDLLTMNENDLRDNIDYAFLARDSMPWTIPWDIFLHYVLPHRTSQEPFQPSRAMLFAELAPLCHKAATMQEALSRVGTWCAQQAAYQPTSRRDLGVISVLDGGYGRCEETNILFMAAARAVGLPVRQVMVPWWQHADGNHAWLEAWTERGWRFLESGVPFQALDQTWFASERSRMPKVVAYAFGHPPDDHVYRTGPGFALVDTTATYCNASAFTAKVVDDAMRPVTSQDVYFSVYSMGGLRPVARATTNSTGHATTILGPGVFLVSCAAGNALSWAQIDTRQTGHTSVTVNTSTPNPLPQKLDFSWPDPLPTSFTPIQNPELDRIRSERLTRWRTVLKDLPEHLASAVEKAGTRTPLWLRVLHGTTPKVRPWFECLIPDLDDKDMLQADPVALVRETELALEARRSAHARGLRYDDSTFRAWVLNPRLHLEPWSPWRVELAAWIKACPVWPVSSARQYIEKWISNVRILPPAYFGPPLTPGQVRASGLATQAGDKAVLVTAALRAAGIPARYQPDWGGVEYYDGTNWLFWKLEDKDETTPGTLTMRVPPETVVLKDFGVSRIENGYLRPLDDLLWQETETGLVCALPAGVYILVVPQRRTNGVLVHLRPFRIVANRDTPLVLDERAPNDQ